jgi:L-ribulose-5-phosphate 3-epimerase UlaE
VYYSDHSDETEKWFAENLALSVSLAARCGIVLAFETMETPFMDTVAKAVSWVNKMQSPWLQVYPDAGNLTNAALLYTGLVSSDLESGKGHLAALHLKETKPGVYREVPYGTGHVDFIQAAKTAWKAGVRMFVGEFWHTGEENWRELLRGNNIFLRDAIEAAVC